MKAALSNPQEFLKEIRVYLLGAITYVRIGAAVKNPKVIGYRTYGYMAYPIRGSVERVEF